MDAVTGDAVSQSFVREKILVGLLTGDCDHHRLDDAQYVTRIGVIGVDHATIQLVEQLRGWPLFSQTQVTEHGDGQSAITSNRIGMGDPGIGANDGEGFP